MYEALTFDSCFITCFHSDAHVLVACSAFLISHKPDTLFWPTSGDNSLTSQHSCCYWILFLCMNESKRTTGPKLGASKISHGTACRHKCISVGTRTAASVVSAKDLFWGWMGHLRTQGIWGMELGGECSTAGQNYALLYSPSFFYFFLLRLFLSLYIG